MNYNKAGKLSAYLLIIVALYLFTSLCSWSLSPLHWEVCARLFFGLITFQIFASNIPTLSVKEISRVTK